MNEFLESKRLTYRFFVETDLEYLTMLLSNETVCAFLPEKKPYPLGLIKKTLDYYITTTKNYRFQHIYIINRKEDNAFIGYAGIQIVREFDKYEIFYALMPKHFNKGYGTEASLRMKQLAKDIGLKEIIALADVENIASLRVLEKTGYIRRYDLELWGLKLAYFDMKP